MLERRTMGTTSETELVATVSDCPWRDGYENLAGVDAVTGELAASAIVPVEFSYSGSMSRSESFEFMRNDENYDSQVAGVVGGRYNLGVVVIDARTGFLDEVKTSSVSTTLVATYEERFDDYDRPSQPVTLTVEAAKLYHDDQASFRKRYGDYFIHGSKRVARFYATYECAAETKVSLRAFEVAVGAATDVFTSKGASKFTKAAKQHKIRVKCSVSMYGTKVGSAPPSGDWSPEGIREALVWFKANVQHAPARASMRHYETVTKSGTRIVHVSPDRLISISMLNMRVWRVRFLLNSCPSRQRASVEDEALEFETRVLALKSKLATQPKELAALSATARTLEVKLGLIRDRLNLYENVRAAMATEPKRGALYEPGETGKQSWLFGFEKYLPNPRLAITSTQQDWSHDWTEDVRYTFRFSNPERMIVGWKVISKRIDGLNGTWWKDVTQILSTSESLVSVRNDFDRAIDYAVVVYHVNAADYQFGR